MPIVGLARSAVEHVRGDAFADTPAQRRLGASAPNDTCRSGPHRCAGARRTTPERFSSNGGSSAGRAALRRHRHRLLPWWAHALKVLRPLQPEAIVLIALRDPRDMLLEWMAFGSPTPFAISSPMAAAVWLTRVLHQVADLDRDQLQPHKLIRVDQAHEDVGAFAAEVGGGLGLEDIKAPPPGFLGPRRFAPGHWRAYADALAEPFARLRRSRVSWFRALSGSEACHRKLELPTGQDASADSRWAARGLAQPHRSTLERGTGWQPLVRMRASTRRANRSALAANAAVQFRSSSRAAISCMGCRDRADVREMTRVAAATAHGARQAQSAGQQARDRAE